MKHTVSVSDLSGFNESPLSGDFIVSSNRDFVTRRVVVGISILYNQTKKLFGIVSAVTPSRIDAPGTKFNSGDMFLVTLATPWVIQNSDGPVIEVECNVCGYSYPTKELSMGRCKWCIDQPKPI
jgi:hypothetical protein